MDKERPGYYAVIPADVRYDDRIPANAKLLYGEISALIGRDGYCFANNGYFSELYRLSERTITGLIKILKDNGYISVYLDRDDSGQIKSRKIFLRVSAPDEQPLENNFYTPRKDFLEGIEKNCGDINLNITNIDIKENKKEKATNKKGSPRKTDFDPLALFVQWIGETFPDRDSSEKNDLYKAVVRFVENRNALKKPMKTKGAVTLLCNKLADLAGGDLSLMIRLLDTAVEHNWQSVFPAKGEPAAKTQNERVYQCV